jgi:epoxyqueuosine reductase
MIERLQQWARSRGYRAAWGPGSIVREIQEEISTRAASDELEAGFYSSMVEAVIATGCDDSDTVIVVAKPVPAHRVSFDLGDRCIDTILPPTYYRYRPTFEEVRQDLAENGLPGARVEHLITPLKATAARLGLVRYGRNNITYVPGIGSYLQLCGYVTDTPLPVVTTEPAGPQLLDECDGCSTCRSACVAGAIAEDRLLLHGEHCLTFANEHPGEWPSWVSARMHHCLLGCLACQRACPVNPRLTVEETGVCFSAEESKALLDGGEADSHTESGIRNKLAWLGQPYAEPVLGRNLKALLDR